MRIIGGGSGLHTPEFHKKKLWERRLKTSLQIIVLALIIGLPIYLARTSRFLISSVEIEGNSVTKSEDIQKIIGDDLSGNYAWIFPRSNTALYPKGKIVRDLMTAIPRLSDVHVERVGAKSLKVTVKERMPAAEYCTDVSDPSSPSDCYFIDDMGYIFSRAPAFSGNVYLTYKSDPFYDLPLGRQLMDADEFQKTRDFVRSLDTLGLYPRVFLIKMDEYHLLLANGAEIMWQKSEELPEVRNNLKAFFSQSSIKSETDFLKRVLYIDMRFGNKIFYKFRGEL
jgi:hypothetical protein